MLTAIWREIKMDLAGKERSVKILIEYSESSLVINTLSEDPLKELSFRE